MFYKQETMIIHRDRGGRRRKYNEEPQFYNKGPINNKYFNNLSQDSTGTTDKISSQFNYQQNLTKKWLRSNKSLEKISEAENLNFYRKNNSFQNLFQNAYDRCSKSQVDMTLNSAFEQNKSLNNSKHEQCNQNIENLSNEKNNSNLSISTIDNAKSMKEIDILSINNQTTCFGLMEKRLSEYRQNKRPSYVKFEKVTSNVNTYKIYEQNIFNLILVKIARLARLLHCSTTSFAWFILLIVTLLPHSVVSFDIGKYIISFCFSLMTVKKLLVLVIYKCMQWSFIAS